MPPKKIHKTGRRVVAKPAPSVSDTTAENVADERLTNAKKVIGDIKERIREAEEGLDRFFNIPREQGFSPRGFPIAYATRIVNCALEFHNEVAMANGAVMVRGIDRRTTGRTK